jgi:hypothetical protein
MRALMGKTLLGEGMTAEIFDWGGGKVLKRFRQGFPESLPDREARIADAMPVTRIRAPRC